MRLQFLQHSPENAVFHDERTKQRTRKLIPLKNKTKDDPNNEVLLSNYTHACCSKNVGKDR